jgi:hypothetical protein
MNGGASPVRADVPALAERVDDALDGLLGAGPGLDAGRLEVGHADGVEDEQHRVEEDVLEVALEQERARFEGRPEQAEEERRIDVSRVVGEDEQRSRELADLLQAVDSHTIAEREDPPGYQGDEVTERGHHCEFPSVVGADGAGRSNHAPPADLDSADHSPVGEAIPQE